MSVFLAHPLPWTALGVLVVNIPFGFWRGGCIKFTRRWLLAVHLPVPIVVALRILSKIGWSFSTFPILVTAFFLGQFLGGKLYGLTRR